MAIRFGRFTPLSMEPSSTAIHSSCSTEDKARTVDLIVTSPPFGLVRKKAYGNVDAVNT